MEGIMQVKEDPPTDTITKIWVEIILILKRQFDGIKGSLDNALKNGSPSINLATWQWMFPSLFPLPRARNNHVGLLSFFPGTARCASRWHVSKTYHTTV